MLGVYWIVRPARIVIRVPVEVKLIRIVGAALLLTLKVDWFTGGPI